MPASENKNYTAYYRYHGKSLHGKIMTNREPLTRQNGLIIKWLFSRVFT